MHLVSLVDQTVSIPAISLELRFAAGETIWTESSHKYTIESLRQLCTSAGFVPRPLGDSWRVSIRGDALQRVIALRGVTKRFGDGSTALHAVDLEIATCRTTVLIGPSGCGKSTVLRLIVGLLEPTTGAVELEGQPLTRTIVQQARRRIGYVIQDGGLFPHLTAEQNITLMARHLRQEASATATHVQELCELTRFSSEHLARYPVELSGASGSASLSCAR
jgi:ABC-type glutathione transport system ATPase component